ncbi:MAG: TonB-dependent receptor [Proteobacteria bacterium]|nr:TonB-dependent receptor [Pseudomonadota bacterium]NOG60958.1 TonB-dependent receptor [Pseudomonadota bacterium]
MIRLIHLLFIHFISTSIAFAGNHHPVDKELQDLLSLDLEELTTVSVASKKNEKVSDAPGIINVITAEEIERFGYRNLRDILDRQPHIQVTGSNLFPHDRITMRGVSFSHTDNVVLVLINGRPVRDGNGVSNNQDFYNAFPVDIINQIEIIRGPGSVLYGTNAFVGAINIITKSAPETLSGKAKLTYGSFDHKTATFTGGGKIGDFEFIGSVKGVGIEGDNFKNITDEAGTVGTYETGSLGGMMTIHAKYKGFTVNSILGENKQDHARSSFILPSQDIQTERHYVDIGYKHEYNADWNSTLNFSYHRNLLDFLLNASTVDQENDNEDYILELSNQGKLTDNINILFGGTYNLKEGFIKTSNFLYSTYTLGAYAQVEYNYDNWLKLIGGLQFNKPDKVDGNYSPRFAAIANFGKAWGAKLLYGEAFREGSPIERFISAPSVVGNDTINPETIGTYDAQIFYKDEYKSFSLTYFHSDQKDLITRVGTLPQQIVNSGEITYDGFELEGTYDFDNGLSFLGNLSYQTNSKSDGVDNATYASDWMFKTGLSYDAPHGFQLSIFNSYFAASTLQNHQVATVTNTNPDADGYNNLTANLRFNLGEVFNNTALSNVKLSLYGDNLLDEDIFFPSLNRRTVNSLPHHMGRGFYSTLNVSF